MASKQPRRSNLMCSVPHNMAILSNFGLDKQVSISKDNKVTAKSKKCIRESKLLITARPPGCATENQWYAQ